MQIESTNPVVSALIGGTAPRPAQVAASRGMLPLPQNDLLEILVAFARTDDAELAGNARSALGSQDSGSLNAALASNVVPVSVLEYFASNPEAPKAAHEAIVRNPRTPAPQLVQLAKATGDGDLLELISLNQQLLIQAPAIIDAILANPARTSEAERRAAETKREFFEKERGQEQVANELRAQGKEAAAQFIEQADLSSGDLSTEDALLIASMIEVTDDETDDSWLGLEYIEELYEETSEQRQTIINKIIGEMSTDGLDVPSERISVINRIMKMGMKDRMRLAMKGDREARNIFIRDPNRIISQAVVANPRITEQEIEKIAAMRSVTEDVLRHIGNSRQWSRSYPIIHNLARNPRTPMANVLPILTRLQLRDLAALAKNRNVPDAVRKQALRLSQMRTGK
jgi:hypothetical protein